MVAGDQIINIPLFQRAFRWTEKNVTQYWDDIESIIDGSSKSHFLGVLVLVAQSRRVGQPVLLDVVDGQQRLTTCYLAMLAMVQVAAERGHEDWAADMAKGFLLTRRFSNFPTNTKLIPSAVDRQQFQAIWSGISNLKTLQTEDWGGTPPSPPQPSGPEVGRMTAAYRGLLKRMRAVYDKDAFAGVERIFDIISGKLSFVTINLRTPTAAPAIFERLNARGEKISVSDLVRNEVFSRVADDPMTAKNIFDSHWEPFIGRFNSNKVELENFLFPYGLTIDSNITKADLFQALRSSWGVQGNPRDIISSMDRFTPGFFLLECGKPVVELPKDVGNSLKDLHDLGAPSSIYPFSFLLIDAVRNGEIEPVRATEAFRLIESFLFRRAICGIEPTGLHAVFKGLWNEAGKTALDADTVRQCISRRTTVPWPSNNDFQNGIVNGALYGRRVAKYAVRQHELWTHGESPKDDFEIEHIFPKTPGNKWIVSDQDEFQRVVDSWGNLIPLTETMNPGVSNSDFTTKSIKYASAVFASAREISTLHAEWDFEKIKARSKEIASWALTRWPHQR